MQENLNFAKICTIEQKKLKMLKEKLDSSQALLDVELSTKTEQLESSANTNECTINDVQLVKKMKN